MSRQQWMAAWICLVMPCVPLLAQGGISGNGAANGAGIRDGVRNGGTGTGTGDGTGPSENGTRNGTVDDNGDGNGNGGGAPGDGATLSGTTFDVCEHLIQRRLGGLHTHLRQVTEVAFRRCSRTPECPAWGSCSLATGLSSTPKRRSGFAHPIRN